MSTRTPTLLSCTAILSIGGMGGGWAIASQLAGKEAGLSFLQFGGLVASVIFVALTVLYKMAERRVIYLILFNVTFGVNLIWYTSCLFLPIFWMSSIDIRIKAGVGIFALCLYYANVVKGMRLFEIRWMSVEGDLLRRYYDRKNKILDWDSLVKSVKLNLSLYIPGVPEKTNPILCLVCIVSMLAGFSLRSLFPVYSVFAWGIPIIIINSILVQMMGSGISQVLMLYAMEKKDSVELRPV